MIKQAEPSIPYVLWRQGRPRYVPGPGHQKLGFKSRDLKHASGQWYTFEEAAAESLRLQQEAANRKAARAEGKRLARPKALGFGRTLGQICEAVFELDEFNTDAPAMVGKREVKRLAKKTVQSYRENKASVRRACDRLEVDSGLNLWDCPAAGFSPELMQKIIDNVHEVSGLVSARRARSFLSMAWTRLGRKEPGALRHLFEDMPTMQSEKGRVRPAEPEEFWAMVEAADRLGRPEMADSFFTGVMYGWRQTDRLTAIAAPDGASHIAITFSKTKNRTGAFARYKLAGILKQRFDAAAARRKAKTVQWSELHIDERACSRWNPDGSWYQHLFAEIRAEAARAVPSCATLTDRDWKDTNQTWLDRCAVDPEIMSIGAGHSTGQKLTALQKKHYVAINQDRLDAAFDKLNAYLERSRPRLTSRSHP